MLLRTSASRAQSPEPAVDIALDVLIDQPFVLGVAAFTLEPLSDEVADIIAGDLHAGPPSTEPIAARNAQQRAVVGPATAYSTLEVPRSCGLNSR